VLEQALRARGAEVDVLALYDTVAEPLSDAQRDALAQADYVTFTSSSTVQFLMLSLDGPRELTAQRLVSIGPVTSQTLRDQGLEPHVEASRHDIPGLVEALVEDAGSGGVGAHARGTEDVSR
jgi:uroporphyrinogen III methyltransferase/synthase